MHQTLIFQQDVTSSKAAMRPTKKRQNVLGHLRKSGTETHFAKLPHILPLKKAWGCCYKGLFLLSPSPPSQHCFEGEERREDASI